MSRKASFDLSVISDSQLRNRLAEMFETAMAIFADTSLLQIGEPHRQKLVGLRQEYRSELAQLCKEGEDIHFKEQCLKSISCLLSGFDQFLSALDTAQKGLEVMALWPDALRDNAGASEI
ncbi:hypothetical protein O4H49_07850 [Kiloniella laminariae]|uniref:Uncharacterized protein n=1 Tax=Kiloniella laminariae TaxID=454162 RepID=A0ABT4LHX0_9PROT|nr:hypothetical protein [Kiloniella laminariae]MCZ4280688.1 hypothetical protein [Kiloniella laminariae]